MALTGIERIGGAAQRGAVWGLNCLVWPFVVAPLFSNFSIDIPEVGNVSGFGAASVGILTLFTMIGVISGAVKGPYPNSK